jgi:predicted outer membrane repeat protein
MVGGQIMNILKILQKYLKIKIVLLFSLFFVCDKIYGEMADNWSQFYISYMNGSNIELGKDIYLGGDLGLSTGNSFTIDGYWHYLDANNQFKGFYLDNQNIIFKNLEFRHFKNEDIQTIDNNVMGGSIIEARQSTLTFNSVIVRDNYAAERGGAMYATGSSITIVNTGFINNTSDRIGNGGGALHITNSIVTVKDSVIFANNTAQNGTGGAIYTNQGSIWEIDGDVKFNRNYANTSGGAIYLLLSNMTIKGTAEFLNNTAQDVGGAIVLDDSSLKLIANNGDFVFKDNIAQDTNLGSDIYMKNNSQLFLNTEKNIIMKGGIGSDNTNNVIIKSKAGKWILSGNTDFNGKIDIQEGQFALKEISNISISSLSIAQNASLYMIDGNATKLYLNQFNVYGNINIDLIREGGNLNTDAIIASDTIHIGTNSYLNIHSDLFFEDIISSSILLGYANNGINGIFVNNSAYWGHGFGYQLNYENNGIYIVISSGERPTISMPGISGNGRETLNAIDDLSQDISYKSDLMDIRDYLYGLSLNTDYYATAQAQQLTEILSGSFFSDILPLSLINNDYNDRIYSHIKDASEIGAEISKSVWISGGYSNIAYNNEIVSGIGKLKNSAYGISAGGNFLATKNFTLGVFAGYEKNSVKRNADNATMNDIRLGVFGGYFDDWFNIRWNISGGIQNFETQRFIQWSGGNTRTPKAEFQTYNIGIGADMEFPLWISSDIDLKPFIALQGGYASNGEIKEKTGGGDESVNLTIKADDYLRVAALGGIKVSKNSRLVNLHLKGYVEFLAVGDKPQYSMFFSSSPSDMKMYGTQIDNLAVGGNIGAEFMISKSVSLMVNIDVKGNSSFFRYLADGAIVYRFGTVNKGAPDTTTTVENTDELFPITNKDIATPYSASTVSEDKSSDMLGLADMNTVQINDDFSKENIDSATSDQIEKENVQAEGSMPFEAAMERETAVLNSKLSSYPIYKIGLQPKTAEELLKDKEEEEAISKEIQKESTESLEDKAIEQLVNKKTESEIAQMSDEELLTIIDKQVKKTEKPPLTEKVTLLVTSLKDGVSELSTDVKETVKKMADNLKKYAFKKIVVEGHPDAKGSPVKNFFLSKLRARAVYAELYNQGIPADKMEYRSATEGKPIGLKNSGDVQQHGAIELSIE